jgi:hypothetical protein
MGGRCLEAVEEPVPVLVGQEGGIPLAPPGGDLVDCTGIF